jgi:uncharacterized protein YdeI (YjbR/CyaY-like superfamily)
MGDRLRFRERGEWRRWLESNHDKHNEAYLLFYKKISGKNGLNVGEAVEEAICFGWIDGILRKVDGESFVVRFTPRKSNSVWSKINRERAERLAASGMMTKHGLSKIEEAKRLGRWDNAYTNKDKESIPKDLRSALSRNKKAWENFQRFANTYRNMYVGWVREAKTKETRERRIKKVVIQSSKNKKYSFL